MSVKRPAISKVLIASNESDALGGVSRFCATLSAGFAERGIAVHWVGMTPAIDPGVFDVPSSVRRTTVYSEAPEQRLERLSRREIRRLGGERESLRAVKAQLREEAIPALRSIVEELDSETLVICTQLFAMEHLIEAGLTWGHLDEPVVFGQYHDSFEAARGSSALSRARAFYSEVDRFIVLTHEDAELFAQHGFRGNIGWLANPVPPPRYDLAQEREKEVISLGRYHPQKNLAHLLTAWARISAQAPGWSLKLYGEGPERADLERLVVELGIEDSAFLMGRAEDVQSAIREASIHAMTSRHEGLPLAIVEASQYGVPTIAYDCAPGIRVLLEDGAAGVVVEQDDVEGFAEELLSLIHDSERRQALGMRALASTEQFRPESVVDAWLSLVDELFVGSAAE